MVRPRSHTPTEPKSTTNPNAATEPPVSVASQLSPQKPDHRLPRWGLQRLSRRMRLVARSACPSTSQSHPRLTRTRNPRTRRPDPQARFGNWLATHLMALRWGHTFTKDVGPFRAIRRDALDILDMRDRNYGWTVEMQIKAVLAGLRILEVPVRYRVRIGQSKVSGTLKEVRWGGGRASRILWTIGRFALTLPNHPLSREVNTTGRCNPL